MMIFGSSPYASSSPKPYFAGRSPSPTPSFLREVETKIRDGFEREDAELMVKDDREFLSQQTPKLTVPAHQSSGLSFQQWRETTEKEARGLDPNSLAAQGYGGYLPEQPIRPEDSYSGASARSHNTSTSLGKRVADMGIGDDTSESRKKRRTQSPDDTQPVDYFAGYTDRLSPEPENETREAYNHRVSRRTSRRQTAIRGNMPQVEKNTVTAPVKASAEYQALDPTKDKTKRGSLTRNALKRRMGEIIKEKFDRYGEVGPILTQVDYFAGYTDRLSPEPENETREAYNSRIGKRKYRRQTAIRENMPQVEKNTVTAPVKASAEYQALDPAKDRSKRGTLVDSALKRRMGEIIRDRFRE